MKKLLVMLPVAIAMLTSCDETVLTASLAKDAVKKDAYWETPYVTTTFNTGYYEITLDELVKFQQLQTAGVIDLVVEKAIEKRESYWRGTEYIDHYFVDVKLTSKGSKYILDEEIKKGRKDLLDELDENNEAEDMPSYMTEFENVDIKLLLPDPTEKKNEPAENREVSSTTDNTATNNYYSSSSNNSSTGTKAETAYEKARSKVYYDEVTVITGEMELVKAKEVYCPEEYQKYGKGECKIIIEFTDKTPFGYTLGAPIEGYKIIKNVNFKRYEDLGWVISE